MIKRLKILLSIAIPLIGVLSPVEVLGEDWPDMVFPKSAEITIVSEKMNFNGVPMKTWTLISDDSIERITEFYRSAWKSIPESLYDEQTIEGWTYINSKQGGFLLTVKASYQLGKTHAYLGISHYEGRDKKFILGQNFPTPRGTTVVNDIQESMIGKEQRFILMTTQQPVSKTFDFYLRRFEKDGWEARASMLDPSKRDAVLAFSKDADEINLSIFKEKHATFINASWVKNKSL